MARTRRLLGTALLLALGVAIGTLAAPTPAHAGTVTLGGVTVRTSDRTAQVVTVNRTRGHHARIGFWRLTPSGWTRVMDAKDGRIGYGGLVRPKKRRQGTGTTPVGTYRLLSAFGTRSRDDAWRIGYRRIRKGDFWVQDNRSAYYNRYRSKSRGGFRWWLPSSDANSSERLKDYPVQYELSVVTSFNRSQVRHRGSGIFLHVNGRGATGGCVSAPRRFLVKTVRRLDPASAPVIAIGR
jgi:L,D-peptidoglycan transpeptidase YkuD (ErfK/YbiS/YcfS/YnhG family)